MCGRLNVIDAPVLAFLTQFLSEMPVIETALNIAPTDDLWVLHETPEGPQAARMRWWLVPSWSKGPQQKFSMFNARSETVATSPAYKDPFKRRRCVIPVSGYFEWRREGVLRQPMYFTPDESEVLLLAGIWDCWQGGDEIVISCSVITTSAHPLTQTFHHRLPMMLLPDEVQFWMDTASPIERVQGMMAPRLPSGLRVVDVESTINNAREKSAGAQKPAGPVQFIPRDA